MRLGLGLARASRAVALALMLLLGCQRSPRRTARSPVATPTLATAEAPVQPTPPCQETTLTLATSAELVAALGGDQGAYLVTLEQVYRLHAGVLTALRFDDPQPERWRTHATRPGGGLAVTAFRADDDKHTQTVLYDRDGKRVAAWNNPDDLKLTAHIRTFPEGPVLIDHSEKLAFDQHGTLRWRRGSSPDLWLQTRTSPRGLFEFSNLDHQLHVALRGSDGEEIWSHDLGGLDGGLVELVDDGWLLQRVQPELTNLIGLDADGRQRVSIPIFGDYFAGLSLPDGDVVVGAMLDAPDRIQLTRTRAGVIEHDSYPALGTHKAWLVREGSQLVLGDTSAQSLTLRTRWFDGTGRCRK